MKKKIKYIIALMFAMMLCSLPIVQVFAAPDRFVDNEGLVEAEDAERIRTLINEVSQRQNMDIVILTIDSLDGKTATEYADDYYDYQGYGFGESKDGILLLISMEYRDWAISTTGRGIQTFTDAGQAFIMDRILPDLSDGNYSECFIDFINLCDKFISQADSGSPYDNGNFPKTPFDLPVSIIMSLVIALVVALIVVLILRSQLTTVSNNNQAADYIRRNSLKVETSRDVYLYSNVVKTPIPKENSSSGSSIHTSSSGTSHGGSSGKF